MNGRFSVTTPCLTTPNGVYEGRIYLKLSEGTDEVHVSAQQVDLLLQPMLFEEGTIMERR